MEIIKIDRKELLAIVEDLKKQGLPEALSFEEVKPTLKDEQSDILSLIPVLAKKDQAMVASYGEDYTPQKDDEWWKVKEEFKNVMEAAVVAGLIHLKFVQKWAVIYGAIPDPEQNWKYYIMPDFSYACWECGSDIHSKQVTHPVHDGPFPLSGSGEVHNETVPYCPKCEKEPSSSGLPIKESPADIREREIFAKMASQT